MSTLFTLRAALAAIAISAGATLASACGVSPAAPQATQPPAPAAAPTTSAATAVPAATAHATAVPTQAAAAPTTQAAPTPAAAPRSGGTLRVGILGDIVSLDPHQLTPPIPDVTFSVWDRLLEYDPKLTPLPLLAESWDMSSDGKQIKLPCARGPVPHRPRDDQ